MKQLYLGLIAGLVSIAASATPVTITFDPLVASGTGFTSIQYNVNPDESSYTESGFVLSAAGHEAGHSGFGSAHSGQTDYYFGSTSLFNDDTNGGLTVLTKLGGGAFALTSMKLAALNNTWSFYPNAEYVTFTGTLENGSTVTQKVLLANNTSFQTVNFVGFDDVTSVTWAQGSATTRSFNQFDDIVVDGTVTGGTPTPAPIPEPGSIALLGLGLVALVSKRRKS